MHKLGQYKETAFLKKQKALKLEQTKRHCELCGKEGSCIHHKDGSIDNHALENLQVLCYKCHNIIHKDGKAYPKETSKYLRLYGKRFVTIWALSGLSDKTVWKILNAPRTVKKDILAQFIERTGIELEDLISNTVPKD